MYSKGLLKTVLIAAVLVILVGLYAYMTHEYQALPSEGWSKDEPLFSYETSTDYEDFFERQLSYMTFNHELNIVYLDNETVKYKVYTDKLDLVRQGQLLKLKSPAEEIYVTAYDDYFEMVIKSGESFSCFKFNKDLKVQQTYEFDIDHPNYHISNSHVMVKKEDNLEVLSSKGHIELQMPNKAYDVVNVVTYDDDYTLYYLTIIDGIRMIQKDLYDKEGHLLKSVSIAPLLVDELRLKPIDFQVTSIDDLEAYKINVKDMKFGTTYLNFYKYDLSKESLVFSKNYKKLQDWTDLISENEMIVLMNHEEPARLLGKSYHNFFNIMAYNLETEEIRALTKTYRGPREYTYLKGDTYDYLIWGELKRGTMTVRIASDDPDYIEASLVLTSERLLDIFYQTIDVLMKVPTYMIVVGIFILAVTMLVIMPCYMLFVTFFEKHHTAVFIIMVILHNLAKIFIQAQFVSRITLPLILENYTLPFMVVTNILAIYTYMVINKHRHFDNPITEYIPFYITDIAFHTLIFGPYIMMNL
ncbi:hypothetical protein EZV73_25625 [Acidaminobacter sp. JC074]|uniref:hypothetical protein n=1 Tax=Acidaminobacter sp. JC074 TaxID=2530199 RepID=UPI001F0F7E8F|nr:hypothetical protein [Acidaminobacter sp. JC074]MCH4890983.1 hypothetical protein [Acidaminobacter sp. JC074]